jgi:hypothetical protein
LPVHHWLLSGRSQASVASVVRSGAAAIDHNRYRDAVPTLVSPTRTFSHPRPRLYSVALDAALRRPKRHAPAREGRT